jgi:hypothetical protein
VSYDIDTATAFVLEQLVEAMRHQSDPWVSTASAIVRTALAEAFEAAEEGHAITVDRTPKPCAHTTWAAMPSQGDALRVKKCLDCGDTL